MSAQDQLGRVVQRWSTMAENFLPLRRFRANPIATTSTAVLAVLLGFVFRRDYQTYMSMGPGGLPHNVVGWIASSLLLRPLTFGRDVRSTKPYSDSTEPSHLSDSFPPRRDGPRPKIGPHPVPHRQLNQLPSDDIKKELVRRVNEIAAKAIGEGIAILKQSGLERHTDALFVAGHHSNAVTPSAAAAANDLKGEFAHVHETGDHSLHMVLSPVDCKRVMDAQWGERHAFDGSRIVRHIAPVLLPMTYVMVYAPRNREEIDIVCEMLRGSIAYMTGESVEV